MICDKYVKKLALLSGKLKVGRWLEQLKTITYAHRVGTSSGELLSALDRLHEKANQRLGNKTREFNARIARMDDYTHNLYINDPDTWIENYGKGGKYNNLKEIDLDGSVTPVIMKDGKFKMPNGWTLSGRYDFIILDGNIIMGDKHSFLSKGKNVDFAGTLHITNKGELTSFDNQSGHYQSSIADRDIFLNAISRTYGLDTNTIIFKPFYE